MNDKELADAIVALGVAEGPNNYVAYSMNEDVRNWQQVDTFVRDWRVAGAGMEKCGNGFGYVLVVDEWLIEVADEEDNPVTLASNESLPRAIVEACVKAKASS